MQSQPGVQASAPAGAMERFVWRMDRAAGVLSRVLERWRYLALALLSAGYFAATCYRASRKLFWFDELFTYYVSGLPDMGSVWRALQAGADLNPPFFYVATRASAGLLGRTELGLRMPEIVGFWIACVCMYTFIARRAGAAAGIAGFLFPIVTSVYYYAYEARPHGMVLGFAALALCCWDATHRDRTPWSRAGFFLALLAAISTHAYAVLLLVPFFVAEVAEFVDSRRIDWGRWLAMLGSVAGIVPSLVLMAAMKKAFDTSSMHPKATALMSSYQPLFGTATLVYIAAFVLMAMDRRVHGRTDAESHKALPLGEVFLLAGFAAIPVLAFLLARVLKSPYFDRYGVAAVIGVDCLFMLAAFRRNPRVCWILCLLGGLASIDFVDFAKGDWIKEPSSAVIVGTRANQFDEIYSWLESLPDKRVPIVLVDDISFMSMIHYAPARVSGRLAHLFFPDDVTIGRAFQIISRINPQAGRSLAFSDLLASRQPFAAIVTTRTPWRIENMVRAGAEITILRSANGVFLASIRFAGAPAAR